MGNPEVLPGASAAVAPTTEVGDRQRPSGGSSEPVILTPVEIAELPLEPLGRLVGVTHRVLWRNDTSMAGVLTVEAGKRLGAHTHRQNHHHIWVLDGEPRVLGRQLAPGSYVYVPSGVTHDIEAPSDRPCTVLYMYLRPGPSP
jgi:anti-sigma factor ChrR (cupin superfamily)